MPVLGVGNPDIEASKRIMEIEIETGVYEKIMQCSAFFPVSEAAKRQVVVHNDFTVSYTHLRAHETDS